MKIIRIAPSDPLFPKALLNIHEPPRQIYAIGNPDILNEPYTLSVVGSRRVTPYGKQITSQLSEDAARAGIVIVSGLALGVDALAHAAAVRVNAKVIAVLASGLDTISPTTNRELAKNILLKGGVIISEYPEGTPPLKIRFVQRNRLVSGLSKAVLVTEAAERSGTLHTARFALEQGKDVMAVPGNVTSPLSIGTNNLIKSGAIPVTEGLDIIHYFGLNEQKSQQMLVGDNQEEQIVLDLLCDGVSDSEELQVLSKLDASLFNQTLTMLELSGRIKPLGAGKWTLAR